MFVRMSGDTSGTSFSEVNAGAIQNLSWSDILLDKDVLLSGGDFLNPIICFEVLEFPIP